MTLTRSDLKWYGNEWGIPATPEQVKVLALNDLRASAHAERDALVWDDDGATVQALANAAGVAVTYVHVDLATMTAERRTV